MEFSQREFLHCIFSAIAYLPRLRIRLLSVARNLFKFHVSCWCDVCRWTLMKEISEQWRRIFELKGLLCLFSGLWLHRIAVAVVCDCCLKALF